MNDRPEPLVPAEVDLRDYDYMPLYGDRLFNSDTWALCDADEKIAALRLWWRAWHEEPAGSLPNNDRLLAERAGYGVAVKAFLAVKKNAMRGWIECSDGRLYHPVVAAIAVDVWRTKRRKGDQNAAERERKRRKRAEMSGGQDTYVRRTNGQYPPDNMPDNSQIPQDVRAENALKGKREVEDKEESKKELNPPESSESPSRSLRSPPPEHVFRGAVIRLTARDFEAWEKSFHAYPDLRAELEAIDAKLVDEGFEGKWFGRVSGWLRAGHEKRLQNGTNGYARQSQEDQDILWRTLLAGWTKRGSNPSRWPESHGIPPGQPGCQIPDRILAEFGIAAARH